MKPIEGTPNAGWVEDISPSGFVEFQRIGDGQYREYVRRVDHDEILVRVGKTLMMRANEMIADAENGKRGNRFILPPV